MVKDLDVLPFGEEKANISINDFNIIIFCVTLNLKIE